jgi:hypothetical protein
VPPLDDRRGSDPRLWGMRASTELPAHNRPMRLAGVAIVFLVAVGAWTAVAATSKPPRCSASDTAQEKILSTPGASPGQGPAFIRFCGLARAYFRVNGKPYRVQGGHCLRGAGSTNRRLSGIGIGFITNRPQPPGMGVVFFWYPASAHADVIEIDDSEIEVPGQRVAASGTVVIADDLNSGSFNLYGRAASGPTGDRVRGRWTCT